MERISYSLGPRLEKCNQAKTWLWVVQRSGIIAIGFVIGMYGLDRPAAHWLQHLGYEISTFKVSFLNNVARQ